jgi:septum formation protein
LAGLGLRFSILPVEVDESPLPGEAAPDLVLRLARAKAAAADAGDALVLAADTIVALDGRPLGKPAGARDAERMLAELSGRAHDVFTGVALRDTRGGRTAAAIERTIVHFAPLGGDEIARYVASGEPLDRAGAYAVQGLAAMFVDSIEGNYNNVVGLPLTTVRRLLRELGHDWEEFRAPAGTAAP